MILFLKEKFDINFNKLFETNKNKEKQRKTKKKKRRKNTSFKNCDEGRIVKNEFDIN